MHDRLRQLCQLLHPERKRIDVAIARFSQPDKEKRFMRTLERRPRRQSRKFRHETHKVDARHFRDERIAFRHVADQRLDLICLAANVAAQNSRGAG